MFPVSVNSMGNRTTSYKVVIPFYLYGGFSFVAACVLLLLSISDFSHYFNPSILAVTHTMVLGWGTMVVIGAAHQLVPVLIEGKLYSDLLGYATFAFMALGIPVLIWGFYVFDMGVLAPVGSLMIIIGVILFTINIALSMVKAHTENMHAIFIFASTVWLLFTIILGFLLVLNFTYPILLKNSLIYLPVHAHTGLAGWFLLLIAGVATRLIPMFLISKYTNRKLLWLIFILINFALISFIFLYLYASLITLIFPAVSIFIAILFFAYYCYKAYHDRLRKKVELPTGLAFSSVLILIIPSILAIVFIIMDWIDIQVSMNTILLYGFILLFGWISSIILGMSFKTLPFILWNRLYQLHNKDMHKVPNPKDMFHPLLFKLKLIGYVSGCIVFAIGVMFMLKPLMYMGALLLLLSSLTYLLHLFYIITLKKQ